MKIVFLSAVAAGALMTLASPALAADPGHGQEVFRAQCGLCHKGGADDGEGGQGPALKGLIGRKLAGDPDFAYTPAFQDAKGAPWSEASLSAFLADPQKSVPGTAMPIKVGSETDRADLAAYLASVK